MRNGVTIAKAADRTGYSATQLRRMVRRGEIRFRFAGRLLFLHAEDVETLAANAWQGTPVQPKEAR